MKTFKFSLQTLLDTREAMEKVREERFAHAVRDCVAAREKRTLMAEKIRRDIDALSGFGGQSVRPDTMAAHLRYVEKLQGLMVVLCQRVVALEAVMEKCRNELQVATRERKMLERLMDIEKARWTGEQRHRDQIEMDELAQAHVLQQGLWSDAGQGGEL
jgi:flagellar export protein FliJ